MASGRLMGLMRASSLALIDSTAVTVSILRTGWLVAVTNTSSRLPVASAMVAFTVLLALSSWVL